MWYRLSKTISSYEEKLLRIDAENFIRRRLFYSGKTSPTIQEVQSHVDRIIKKLEKKHGSLNNVRLSVPGESLAPAFDALGEDALS